MNRSDSLQTLGSDHKQSMAGFSAPSHESIQAGRFVVRFANNAKEVQDAQALRYRTLFVEQGGRVTDNMLETGREEDKLDDVAHHVIVIDREQANKPVVGTLRLVSSVALSANQRFYTEQAYNIDCLRARYNKLLELSRFCIDPDGRSGAILKLIWKFTLQFIIAERFDLMLGCASFPGTDTSKHQSIMSYLYQNNLAPEELRVTAVSGNSVRLDSFLAEDAEWREAKRSVPTLLRGYLKVGAKITDTAIIDPVFNTVFVGIYVDARDMVMQNNNLTRNS
ncbi:MAG: GNAT family N-acetyltransferase [Pseudomonadales bacterium]